MGKKYNALWPLANVASYKKLNIYILNELQLISVLKFYCCKIALNFLTSPAKFAQRFCLFIEISPIILH